MLGSRPSTTNGEAGPKACAGVTKVVGPGLLILTGQQWIIAAHDGSMNGLNESQQAQCGELGAKTLRHAGYP